MKLVKKENRNLPNKDPSSMVYFLTFGGISMVSM